MKVVAIFLTEYAELFILLNAGILFLSKKDGSNQFLQYLPMFSGRHKSYYLIYQTETQ